MLRASFFLCVCAWAGLVMGAGHHHRISKLSHHYHGSHQSRLAKSLLEDAWLKVPELVRKYGYPLEVHEVTTEDGYVLTMHRIRHGKDHHNDSYVDRPVVFIMHGLLSSSADWVVMGPGKGLAYILAEEGFDVWLGNARGNRYSRRHTTLDPDADEGQFWQYSWDEIGNFDVPSMIDFALEVTGKEQLHYIGHSQGTTSFFVMCSLRPEYNQKIISMNALAPVAYMAHSGSRLRRAMAPFSGNINRLLRNMGLGELLPTMEALRVVGKEFCRDGAGMQKLCTDIMVLIGWNSEQFNKTMVPVQLGHVPAGASVRQFAHYGQNMRGKEFRRFHHSYLKNLYHYGSFKAPSYELSNVKAPVYLHYAMADTSAHYKDVRRLKNEIGNAVKAIKVQMKSFNHLDFLWGVDAKVLVYDKVVDIIKSYDCI